MALTGREMRPCWPQKVAVCIYTFVNNSFTHLYISISYGFATNKSLEHSKKILIALFGKFSAIPSIKLSIFSLYVKDFKIIGWYSCI